MLVALHCHTQYSFDCQTSINDIVKVCRKKNVGCILISDHDVFGLTAEDFRKFEDEEIIVLSGIEFTTKEGIHIIGVHHQIKRFERERYFYSVVDLIGILKKNNAWIIIPHPTHSTGIFSANLSDKTLDFCLENSHFIEKASSKYGKFDVESVLKKYTKLRSIVSDDAHFYRDIGIMLNKINLAEKNKYTFAEIFSELFENATPHYDKKSLIIREIKKGIRENILYQSISRRISKDFKQKVKCILKRN